MCTVIYLPLADGVLMSSNRDEHIGRPPAVYPSRKQLNGKAYMMPIDAKAGGTWIAMGEQGTMTVLFNGAFKKHHSAGPYRMSRGLILIELLQKENIDEAWYAYGLEGIEPFSIIHFQQSQLCRYTWDGLSKHIDALNPLMPYIWSSATLYDAGVAAMRQKVFENWLGINSGNLQEAELIQLLHSAIPDDECNRFVMRRPEGLATVSITTMQYIHDKALMRYYDLQNATVSSNSLLQVKWQET